MGNSNWKDRFNNTKPSKRRKIYSSKLNRFLDEEEEKEMTALLQEKRAAIVEEIKKLDDKLTDEQAQSLADQMITQEAEVDESVKDEKSVEE